MKPFRFKNFTINQSEKVFRVGTDGVLLGVLATVENAGHILEVGTGTGLISLMLSQRNRNAAILAIDFSKDAAQLASENFKNSPFSKNLKALEQDFKTFESEEKFDVIVSNPPYFEKNQSEKDVIARQQTELSFDDLIEKSVKNVLDLGSLFEFLVVFMSVFVAVGFEFHFFIKSFLEVDSGLIGQAQYYKNHVGQFFAQVFIFIAFFFGLFSISASDNSGNFTYFFCKLCHIG